MDGINEEELIGYILRVTGKSYSYEEIREIMYAQAEFFKEKNAI